MHDAHVFDGMDVIVRSHSSSATSRPAPGFGTCCMNIDGTKYTFSGAPAHQMTAWNGPQRADAVIHLFDNIDASAATSARRRASRASSPRAARRRTSCPITTGGRLLHPLSRRGLPGAGHRVRGQRGQGGGARHRHQGEDRPLRQGSRRHRPATLAEVGFAYMKKFGATNVDAGAGQAAGLRGDRQRVARHPGPRLHRADVHLRPTTPTRWTPTT